jgi:hypothetical protein
MAYQAFRKGGKTLPAGALVPTRFGRTAAQLAAKGFFDQAPAGPTTFYKTITGLISASAIARKRSDGGLLSGTITMAGVLTERLRFGKTVVGSITQSGIIRRKTSKRVLGSVTGSGIVRKKTSHKVAGVLTIAATIVKKTKHKVTGGLAVAGSLFDRWSTRKATSGSLSATGSTSTTYFNMTLGRVARGTRALYALIRRR